MLRFTIRDVLWLTLIVAAVAPIVADEREPTLKELLRRATERAKAPSNSFNGDFDFLPFCVSEQMRYHGGPRWEHYRHILVISWFGSKSAILYTVTDEGEVEDFNTCFALISGRRFRGELRDVSDEDMKRLKLLSQALPESKAEPPISRTVVVSFQSAEKWRTETYDASALPDEFENILRIIGERWETKARHKKK
jgi:hypothetical protein